MFLALSCYVLCLGPVLGLVDIYFMRYSLVADHYQYFALPAITALAAAALARAPSALRLPRPVAPAVAAVLVVVLAVLTWRQQGAYRDAESLWRDTLAKNPDAWLAHADMAQILSDRGEHAAALERLEAALAIEASRPSHDEIHHNIGFTLSRLGRYEAALAHYREAHALSGGMETRIAVTLERLGRDDEAETMYRRALEHADVDHETLQRFGMHLMRRGRTAEAIPVLERLTERFPDDVNGHMVLSNTLARLGRLDEAIAAATRGLERAEALGDERETRLIRARLAQLAAMR